MKKSERDLERRDPVLQALFTLQYCEEETVRAAVGRIVGLD